MLYPMFAMVILIHLVACRLLYLRVTAVRSGKISIGTFRLNSLEGTPAAIQQNAKNFGNLFEIPVLFFAAGILSIILHHDGVAMNILAWLFVLVRIAHSWIHLTYNNVMHRLSVFVCSTLLVLLMWIFLLV